MPDTLDLLVSEGIKRPRSGIPDRWMQKKVSNAMVKVLPPNEAAAIVASESARSKNSKKAAFSRGGDLDSEKNTAKAKGTDPRGQSRQRPEATTQRRLQDRNIDSDADNEATARKRNRREVNGRARRQRRQQDGQYKPIYTGRPSSSRKTISQMRKGDPPSPNTKLWPEMDTFRRLLRQEADFRLRILGKDWTETVRQETIWRHKLYADWLWTLKNGIGDPIVESRSDRFRRIQEQSRREEEDDFRKRTRRLRGENR